MLYNLIFLNITFRCGKLVSITISFNVSPPNNFPSHCRRPGGSSHTKRQPGTQGKSPPTCWALLPGSCQQLRYQLYRCNIKKKPDRQYGGLPIVSSGNSGYCTWKKNHWAREIKKKKSIKWLTGQWCNGLYNDITAHAKLAQYIVNCLWSFSLRQWINTIKPKQTSLQLQQNPTNLLINLNCLSDWMCLCELLCRLLNKSCFTKCLFQGFFE